MSKARVFDYISRKTIPAGWWRIFEDHAKTVWSKDPNATMFIVDDYGALRVDTSTFQEDLDQFRKADSDIFWASKTTCPCCGRHFRERDDVVLAHWYEKCPDCRFLSWEESSAIEFEIAKQWFQEEDW